MRYGHLFSPRALFWSGSHHTLGWGCPAPSGLAQACTRSLPGSMSSAPRVGRSRVPRVSTNEVVSEYQPILHRLWLYACGLGPTNPTRMFLPSETLGLRRTRFSRALSLLIPAFALRLPPAALPSPPSPGPNAPLPLPQRAIHGFGQRLKPRSIVGAGTLDQ